MQKPEIFQAYDNLPKGNSETGDRKDRLNLRDFIRNYAVSLPAIISAFPKDNLDINALEAHVWDRLKTFYKYENFGEVDIEAKEEVEFINKAIRLIEEWFYKGEWTSCLQTPKEQDIREMLSGRENSYLQRVRRSNRLPNLGRDGIHPGSPPLPNIYEDAKSGRNLRDVYLEHAFKLFHGSAAEINTLTNIRSNKGISANESKFKGLINSTSQYYPEKLQNWGYEVPGTRGVSRQINPDRDVASVIESEKRMRAQLNYTKLGQEYRPILLSFKNALIAAELIRRTGEGQLTKQGFINIMAWLRGQVAKQTTPQDLIAFNFAGEATSRSSMLYANTKQLPFSLFEVDNLKHMYDSRKK